MASNILFAVDHKNRDLPSYSLIGYYLKKYGYILKYVSVPNVREELYKGRFEFLVYPKPNYSKNIFADFVRQGGKIIVIDTEGNNQEIEHKYKINLPPHLYFLWNKNSYDKYEYLNKKFGTELVIGGYYRSDFSHANLRSILTSKNDLLREYKISKDSKIITLASSLLDFFLDDKTKNAFANRLKELREGAADSSLKYYDEIENMKELYEITNSLIQIIIKNYKNIIIIIKPHPNENIKHWRNFALSYPNNIRLMLDKPINDLLIMSDLHIAHNACTTISECMLMGVPSVEIQTDKSNLLYNEDHLKISDYVLTNPKKINDIIDYEIKFKEGSSRRNTSSARSKYIKKYYDIFDGNRCLFYSNVINRYCSENSKYIKRFNFNHYQTLFRIWIKKIIKLIINTPSILSKLCNLDPIMKKTDFRGRYENRINNGDEKVWFSKFEKNKL